MAEVLAHRGPDATRIHPLPGGALVSTRLAIIDPAGSDQPLTGCTPDVCAVYNGEIYNYRHLRELLRRQGHHLHGQGDGEVITHLYEQYGRQFVEHLRGAFAIALFDARTDELILARDRMGEKPLVYAVQNTTVSFASEIRALQPAVGAGAVRPESLPAYLLYGFAPEPATLLEGVSKLPAGHFAVVRRDAGVQLTLHRYWTAPVGPPANGGEDAPDRRGDLITVASAALAEAVEQQTYADVPVAVALSGGVDSTLLARIAARTLTDLRTYTVGFDWTPTDELDAAAATAQALHSKHTEIRLSVDDYLHLLRRGSRSASEPIADWTLPAYLALTTHCHDDGVRVLLTGHGPDELFLAYRWVRQAIAYIRQPGSPPETIDAYTFNPEYAEAMDLIDSVLTGTARAIPATTSATLPDEAFRQHLRSALLRGYLVSNGLMQLDTLGLMNAVEVRVPYVDHKFVEAVSVLETPGSDREAMPKAKLYAIAETLDLPIHYVAKRPFFPTLAAVTPSILSMAQDHLLSGELAAAGLIRPNAVRQLLLSTPTIGNGLNVLFRLLMLEMWLTHLRKPAL
ncbi:asparagine synthase (glutamine-hydrolyzing) [Micromonospora zamorensis]|uniref:asparagine synthase (glutamine-hydrolyzing) n=1 Tax=Micromonospora zamorensis TaxID=709883 RepID=UPI0037B9CB4A